LWGNHFSAATVAVGVAISAAAAWSIIGINLRRGYYIYMIILPFFTMRLKDLACMNCI